MNLLDFSVRNLRKVSSDVGFCLETLDKLVSLFETDFLDFSEFEKIQLMRRYKKILLKLRVISRNVGDFLIFLPDFLSSAFFDSK